MKSINGLTTKDKELQLFSNTQQQKNHEGQQSSGMEASGVAILFAGVMGYFFWNKHGHKIEVFYFNHFEEIYLSVYAVVILFLFYLLYLFKKSTLPMTLRANLLSPLWSNGHDNIEVGKTSDGINLFLSDKARCSHVQVIGTTGSGKSHSIVVPWTVRDLQRGYSSVIIDGKGSKDLPYEVFSILDRAKITCGKIHFDLGDIENSIKINPLMHGSPQQITDRIFSSFEFLDPYYRSIQYDICGYLVLLIQKTGEVVTFSLLHELLTNDLSLTNFISKLKDGTLKANLKNYLREPIKERKNKLSGLVSQMSPFAVGEVASIVNGTSSELKNLLLSNSGCKCLIFSIPTLKYQKLGHQLGKLILQELSWCVGKRESMEAKSFVSVFLDEFSEFSYEEFISVLNKARSAKVGLHLCHQAISDLTKVSDSFARGINTNTNIKCVLGLNDPETADFYARHFGTKSSEKLTEQVRETGWFKKKEETGRGSMREVEEYKVHPNILKGLYEGDGVLHLPTRNGLVTERIRFKPIDDKELSID